MKKVFIYAILTTMLGILLFACLKNENTTQDNWQNEVLRIHIRANSNSAGDQAVKYQVKTAITDFITPLLTEATTKQRAIAVINDNLKSIQQIAQNVLNKNSFNYYATAKIKNEYFPTRDYNNTIFPAGQYDALLIELGSANGDNWWCVVYPPLCFVGAYDTGGNNIVYQSKLLEIIQSFFKKQGD